MRAPRGQATVEWVGICLLVAVLLAAGALAVHAGWLARALRCAIAGGRCPSAEAEQLAAAYGPEVGALVRARAPGLVYEHGTLTLPVDFRHCASHACSDGPDEDADLAQSESGQPATAFTHVVDERPRGGDLFVQYWLYYPDSTWNGIMRHVLGDSAPGWHRDDWESYQLRIAPGGRVLARASSHEGYEGHKDFLDWNQHAPSFLPGANRAAWTPATGWTRVSRGSHAGHIVDGPGDERRTAARQLHLVPIERLSAAARARLFSIAAPWRKPVYADPERTDT